MLEIKKIELPSNEMLERIIPFYDTKFGKMINARELHYALGIKKKFSDWIKLYTKGYSGYNYGTSEEDPNIPEEYDYFVFEIPATQGRGKSIEYYLSIDMGKEIAMMTRSSMGKEVRRYFISAEKALIKMHQVLAKKELSAEEKIAEALLLSQEILAQKEFEIKKANRNREYNKKVNVNLRREIKALKEKINQLPSSDEKLKIILTQKEEEIEFMEGSIERLEDQNAQLKARLNHLISIKLDGKSILNAFAAVDAARRQKFAIGKDAKEKAKIKAYVFRKDAITNAGIILNNDPRKTLVDNINVNDMEKAVIVYISALKKLINDTELFEELFENQLVRANEFLGRIEFEKQEEEEAEEIY